MNAVLYELILYRKKNAVLHTMLTQLEQPFLHPLQAELVSEVLRVCPDLLVTYLPSVQATLLPRNSPNWLSGMDFLFRVNDRSIAGIFASHSRTSELATASRPEWCD